MTIQELILHVEIRLEYLKNLRVSNIQLNNTEMIFRIETEIFETEQTLETLKNN